jgi:sodium/potassium/calcium exchanger 6
MLGCLLAGVVAAGFTLVYADDGSSKPWRLVRCFAGFVCSMVWIAAIADEVVTVLQVSSFC